MDIHVLHGDRMNIISTVLISRKLTAIHLRTIRAYSLNYKEQALSPIYVIFAMYRNYAINGVKIRCANGFFCNFAV